MIIVGLGNTGIEYENTRHNVGFMAAISLSEKLSLPLKKKQCLAVTGEKQIKGEKLVVALPQTYMNLSGESVNSLVKKYSCPLNQLVVIYDDFELPLGKIRIRMSGGAGTHNGMKSIISCLNSKDFIRIRVGTGAPEGSDNVDYKKFVLSKFSAEELSVIKAATDKAADACLEFFGGKTIENVMNKYNANQSE